MIHSKSIKIRMLVSTGANVFRAMITFATGLIIARSLAPSDYGDLMFLLGSFVAIRIMLDMGSSNAFYTFISKKNRSHRFHIYYCIWLVIQFLATLLFVFLISPSNLFEKIWLGNSSYIVILALLASFLQQQVWQTVGQIGEANRSTGKVQVLNVSVALFYLAIILFLFVVDGISVESVLLVLIAQFLIATLIAYWYLEGSYISESKELSFGQVMGEYWVYCRPLIILSVVSFLYEFADKWLLQRYGGSVQQGYFQVASQFAGVALLATVSVLNVFWKELAEVWEKGDFDRASELYRKVSRGLFMLAAIMAGFLIPWAEDIVITLLGNAYAEAWPILAIMLVYPVYQSLGQVGGAMLLATGYTQRFMQLSIFIMCFSIPITLFVLLPEDQYIFGGLGLGALGLAVKIVFLAAIAVILKSWVIARCTGWKFDWLFQVIGLPLMVGLGYLAKMLIDSFLDVNHLNILDLAVSFLLTGFVYLIFVGVALWINPWLIGLKRIEMLKLMESFGFRRTNK